MLGHTGPGEKRLTFQQKLLVVRRHVESLDMSTLVTLVIKGMLGLLTRQQSQHLTHSIPNVMISRAPGNAGVAVGFRCARLKHVEHWARRNTTAELICPRSAV